MKIYNRKLAKRIRDNEALLVSLLNRLGDNINPISQETYFKTRDRIQAEIDCYVRTLADYGFDRKGNRVIYSDGAL